MEPWIRFAGIVHLGILAAALHVPFVLQWRSALAGLPPLLRQLIWVHGIFIALVITGFGVLSFVFAGDLAAGSPLARAVCGFIAIFWLARLPLQFVFDARPYLTHWYLKAGDHALTLAFALLGLIYAAAAVLP